ncbi:MAG: hypothetical protein RJA36_2268 [Pseudomonadota bacterium]|jgi:hypothetical protein
MSELRVSLVLLAALMAGCGPRDREACIAEAATKPTDTGVRVAMAQCNRQFPQPTAAQPQQ